MVSGARNPKDWVSGPSGYYVIYTIPYTIPYYRIYHTILVIRGYLDPLGSGSALEAGSHDLLERSSSPGGAEGTAAWEPSGRMTAVHGASVRMGVCVFI